MKQMQREGAASKARRAERRADEKSGLISIKPMKMEIKSTGTGTGGGFKKAGFKNAFAATSVPDETDVVPSIEQPVMKEGTSSALDRVDGEDEDQESDFDDFEDFYDPRRPTDCYSQCPGYVP